MSEQCTESERLWHIHPYMDIFIKTSPQGPGAYAEEEVERLYEPKVVDAPKDKVYLFQIQQN